MSRVVWIAFALSGCFPGGVTQVAGVGAVYSTRCSAEMEPRGMEYVAKCDPPACGDKFHGEALNQVVVAIVPDVKVIGYAERVCVQDLSNGSALFQPPGLEEEAPPPPAPAAAAPAEAPRPPPVASEGVVSP
jgi:hypothetical protein